MLADPRLIDPAGGHHGVKRVRSTLAPGFVPFDIGEIGWMAGDKDGAP